MGMVYQDDVLTEILQRARRTETRLMKLCEAMEVDVTNGKVRCKRDGTAKVSIESLDVGFGDCLRFCQQEGILGVVEVTFRGQRVGSMEVAAP